MAKLEGVKRARDNAVANPRLKPRDAYADLSNSVLEVGGSKVSYNAKALARTIQRAKRGSRNVPKLPRNFEEMEAAFPEELKCTSDGQAFLVYSGPVSKKNGAAKMLLFMTARGAGRLEGSLTWYLDGTFRSAPKPFAQVRKHNLFSWKFCKDPSLER